MHLLLFDLFVILIQRLDQCVNPIVFLVTTLITVIVICPHVSLDDFDFRLIESLNLDRFFLEGVW